MEPNNDRANATPIDVGIRGGRRVHQPDRNPDFLLGATAR
jgi:hypothetical protein